MYFLFISLKDINICSFGANVADFEICNKIFLSFSSLSKSILHEEYTYLMNETENWLIKFHKLQTSDSFHDKRLLLQGEEPVG